MAREWKPGDVAMCAGMLAFYTRDAEGVSEWTFRDGSTAATDLVPVPIERRLVVLDPESPEDAKRFWAAWSSATHADLSSETPLTLGELRMQAALRALANPEPPRIPEPGTWGVVEASCVHIDTREKWVRHEDGNWWPARQYGDRAPERAPLPDDWDSLIDPILVREGVIADA